MFALANALASSNGTVIRVSAQQLHAHLGDADVLLRGTADVRTSKTSDQGLVALIRGEDATVAGEGVEAEVEDQESQRRGRQIGAKTSEHDDSLGGEMICRGAVVKGRLTSFDGRPADGRCDRGNMASGAAIRACSGPRCAAS